MENRGRLLLALRVLICIASIKILVQVKCSGRERNGQRGYLANSSKVRSRKSGRNFKKVGKRGVGTERLHRH